MWFKDYFKRFKKVKKTVFNPFELVKTERGDYKVFIKKLKAGSLVILINGKRGSGKTALGMLFLEFFIELSKRKVYALGFSGAKLPSKVKKVDDIEQIKNNSVALIDEGAVQFSSRESLKSPNKHLGKLMAIARHKSLTPILVTQNSGMIDLNVLRLADTIILKEPSLLQTKFERKAIKEIYEKAMPYFEGLKNKKSYFYIVDDDFEGLVKSGLPSFWNDEISKSFSNF